MHSSRQYRHKEAVRTIRCVLLYEHGDICGAVDIAFTSCRWAWESIPVLQLPPIQTGVVNPPLGESIEGRSRPPPRGAVARIESRVLQVKEDNGVENILRMAEDALRLRHRCATCWTYRQCTAVSLLLEAVSVHFKPHKSAHVKAEFISLPMVCVGLCTIFQII